MKHAVGVTLNLRSFVEVRGRPWLVEDIQGESTDLQTLNLSCIADDAQGERLEILWDAEIGAIELESDGWRTVGTGLPDRAEVLAAICAQSGGVPRRLPIAISCRPLFALAFGSMPTSFCRCARRFGCRGSIF